MGTPKRCVFFYVKILSFPTDVVDKNKVFESIDKLKKIGGKGILIMTVDQMVK